MRCFSLPIARRLEFATLRRKNPQRKRALGVNKPLLGRSWSLSRLELLPHFLTISLEHPTSILIGDAGLVATALLILGLIGSVIFAGNPHAFSLWIAGAINGIFYYFVALVIHSLLRRIGHRFWRNPV